MVSSPWTGKPLKCLWMDKKSYTVISVSLSGYIISKTVIGVRKCSVQCLFSMNRYLSEKKRDLRERRVWRLAFIDRLCHLHTLVSDLHVH